MGMTGGCMTSDKAKLLEARWLGEGGDPARLQAAKNNGVLYPVAERHPLIPCGDGIHSHDWTRSYLVPIESQGTPVQCPAGERTGKQ